jgi:di/tricarboxylate transporter
LGGSALFICPAKGEKAESILEWDDTKKMAWGILLLFGGGISLANGLENAGLMEQLGQWLAQFAANKFILVLGYYHCHNISERSDEQCGAGDSFCSGSFFPC